MHELSLTGAPRVILDAFDAVDSSVETQIATLWDGPLSDRARRIGPLFVRNDFPSIAPRNPIKRGQAALARRILRRRWSRRLTQRSEGAKFDLIYVNSVAALPLLRDVLRVFSDTGKSVTPPILLHIHELPYAITNFRENYPYEFSEAPSHVIAASNAVRDALIDRYNFKTDRITVIHEFISEETLARGVRRQMRSAPVTAATPFVIGGAGSVDIRKGWYWWLQMALQARQNIGRDLVRFVWVGTPNTMDGVCFREMARTMGLEGSIEFIPPTPDPYQHFATFDLFAQMSWEDPCPIVVLENMAFGNPVLCFAGSGGAPEEIAETGVTVANFSPYAMGDIAAELARDPARRIALGQAAQIRVAQRFTASIQTPKIAQAMYKTAGRCS